MKRSDPSPKVRRRSIARQMTISLFLVSILIFLATEALILERSHHAFRTALDADLRARVDALDALTDVEEDGRIEFDFSDEVMPDYSGTDPTGFFALLLDEPGGEIGRSRSLDGVGLELPREVRAHSFREASFWSGTVEEQTVRFIALHKRLRMTEVDEDDDEDDPGLDGEVLEEEEAEGSRRIEPTAGVIYSDVRCLYVVGVSTAESDAQFWGVFRRTTLALGIGLVLLLLTSRIVLRRSLRCLDDFKSEVQTISATNLKPVSVPLFEELAAVARTLNEVVQQLHHSFARERQFTANVAHELRTPLAEIRTMAEVALTWSDNLDQECLQSFQDVLDSSIHLQHIVEKLLMLSRFDSEQLHSRQERFVLAPAILPVWERYRPRAEARELRLEQRMPDDCTAFTDEHMLRTIFENVLSNAVDYSEPGSRIELEVHREGERTRLCLSNRVADLESSDLPNLFDRFWRKDSARTVDVSHSGLGLSVVKSLAAHLGIELSVQLEESGRFRIDLVMPS